MKYLIGIDPGVAGGIAFHDENMTTVYDLPTIKAKRGKTAQDIDAAALVKIIRAESIAYDRFHAFVELVQSRPRQAGMFAFGMNFGKVLGALEVLGIQTTLVSSSAWKQTLGLRGEDKSMSVKLAEQLFPALKAQLYGPRGAGLDGRAEALLLAYFGAHHAN
jgi:hypothetical protein